MIPFVPLFLVRFSDDVFICYITNTHVSSLDFVLVKVQVSGIWTIAFNWYYQSKEKKV